MHPYQCLATCSADNSGSQNVLFAACGPKLFAIQPHTGSVLSSWPVEDVPLSARILEDEESEGLPGKKRKLTPAKDALPNIIKLVVSRSNRYVVAVTAEDKCIRVLELDSDLRLRPLSQRCMPKRPCAITLTPDDQVILCGDKFGDVYALPLLPTREQDQAAISSYLENEEASARAFKPSATDLTVHTGRNRKALEAQLKQGSQPARSKEALRFAHELLLGHVSMLTDVVFIEKTASHVSSAKRGYIITSDRDEHIRVSRGPPQAHIIEGYCLGHTEFVSKLCPVGMDLLVSGGGDDHLFVWEWQKGQLLQKIPIRKAVLDHLEQVHTVSNGNTVTRDNVAVSGMWTFGDPSSSKAHIVLACEGISALFYFPLERPQQEVRPQALALAGNAIDVTVVGDRIVASIDNVHIPNSVSTTRSMEDAVPRLQAFDFSPPDGWRITKDLTSKLQAAACDSSTEVDPKAVRELLYTIENLRKRGSEE